MNLFKLLFKSSNLVVFTLLLISCEKEITIDLPGVEPELVVDGFIENDKVAVVKLTRSSGYFDPIPLPSDTLVFLDYILNKLTVQGAIITVTDGITTDTLVLSLDFINNLEEYDLPYVYKGQNLIGVPGRHYDLKIVADGKTVTATTTIPQLITLDSLWWQPDINSTEYGFAWCTLNDPDSLGNAYRMFCKRGNSVDKYYFPPEGSEFDDQFINGEKFNFPFNRANAIGDTALTNDDPYDGKYKIGDSIMVKYTTIDKAHFEFWRSFAVSSQSNGSPFASPINLKSNINGGYGVWGGYGATYISVVAQ